MVYDGNEMARSMTHSHTVASKKQRMTTPAVPSRPRRRAAAPPGPAAAVRVLDAMRAATGSGKLPSVSEIARRDRDPFRILVSTLLSLRTKDDVTEAASARLFALADTPRALGRLATRTIARAIYPVGFYRTKARTVRDVSRRIDADYGGAVPDTMEELLTFKGVGRKTAALVVSLGYGRDAICVDTHVHRISNRLGWVVSRTPAQTEQALMQALPRRRWIDVNEIMVGFGQRVCTPLSPRCSSCPVARECRRAGVTRHR
jgi:endonuclease-3